MKLEVNKKVAYKLFVLFAGFVLSFNACSKKEDTTATPIIATCSDGIQNQGETGIDCGGPCAACPPATTQLCDGNGTQSYYPLKADNEWSYKSVFENYTNTVTDTQTRMGYLYYEVTYKGISQGEIYLRTDPITNDVYKRVYKGSTNTFVDYLVTPGTPVLNQEWNYPVDFEGLGKRKVTSLNATATQSGCTYTGLLEIKEYFGDGSLSQAFYYKKGLGLIKNGDSWGYTTLTSVILK